MFIGGYYFSDKFHGTGCMCSWCEKIVKGHNEELTTKNLQELEKGEHKTGMDAFYSEEEIVRS